MCKTFAQYGINATVCVGIDIWGKRVFFSLSNISINSKRNINVFHFIGRVNRQSAKNEWNRVNLRILCAHECECDAYTLANWLLYIYTWPAARRSLSVKVSAIKSSQVPGALRFSSFSCLGLANLDQFCQCPMELDPSVRIQFIWVSNFLQYNRLVP